MNEILETKFKCYFCKNCNGRACKSQLPGMGGVFENANFIQNVADWKKIRDENPALLSKIEDYLKTETLKVALAPMTGAVENMGFSEEGIFYEKIVQALKNTKVDICLGDGHPDEKLLLGIKAVENAGKKAAVFIKPYFNSKIIERMEWASKIANCFGVDTDAYNIVTMRNKVNLDKKNVESLTELKKIANEKYNVPFAIKGIFTKEDLEIVKQVKPDIAFVSNHGGRVETDKGSCARFLFENADELKKSCKELWVDGGIRTSLDIATAYVLGANKVLLGRPFISAICKNDEQGVLDLLNQLSVS